MFETLSLNTKKNPDQATPTQLQHRMSLFSAEFCHTLCLPTHSLSPQLCSRLTSTRLFSEVSPILTDSLYTIHHHLIKPVTAIYCLLSPVPRTQTLCGQGHACSVHRGITSAYSTI